MTTIILFFVLIGALSLLFLLLGACHWLGVQGLNIYNKLMR